MNPEVKAALDAVLDRPGGLSEQQVADIEPYLDPDNRNDVAITAIVNRGRTRIVRKLVGEGAVSDAMGLPAGPLFMRQVRIAAESDLPDGATVEQTIEKATVEELWRHLVRGDLDVGMPMVRDKIAGYVGTYGFTQAHADAVLSLAVADDPLPLEVVSRALNVSQGRPVL